MDQSSINSPLLGYNTNVRHAGHLFHIQTEDSGRGHPHVITHLFTEGTILSSKKTSYKEHLEKTNWEDVVRQLMKDQHKSMFVELRDGLHDEIAEKIIGTALRHDEDDPKPKTEPVKKRTSKLKVQSVDSANVKVITRATIDEQLNAQDREQPASAASRGMSIFETPSTSGSFGESLISDKSLDEVILGYLSDDDLDD